jgi:hypothetical protein
VPPLSAAALRPLGADDILRLDVAVADAPLVQVRDGREELPEDARGLGFDEDAALHDVVHQLAAVQRFREEQQPLI